MLDANPQRIGVIGLTFKEDTDDLRESPVVNMLEYLIGKGRDLRIFDAHVSLDSIYGTNRNFLLNAIPHISRLLQGNLKGVFEWADCLVITQKPSVENRALLRAVCRSLILRSMDGCSRGVIGELRLTT